MNRDILTREQETIVIRVLAEEQARRYHLVIALSGAHAYGFPSPDSDIDLKAIHIDPTTKVLGMHAGAFHADRMEIIEGVEIDYTSNELKPVLTGILQGNGNYIERVLGALLPHTSPELEELKPLTQEALSKRLFRHYLGFATSQLKAYQAESPGTAKKLLYVLRTALTGTHALKTGRVVTDLRELIDEYGFADARELIEAKRTGEKVPLSGELGERWSKEIERAFTVLEEAYKASPLPADPPNAEAIEAWLIAERRKRF